MIVGLARLSVLVCALSVSCSAFVGSAGAAPRAAELGPQVQLSQARDGFVGRLAVSPTHGPVGTPVSVSGEGFPPEQQLDLVWRTVDGHWKVTVAEYFGREFTPVAYRIAAIKSDKAGRVAATFVAPEDFGFLHDVVIEQGDRLLTKAGFSIDITAKLIGPASGPAGTPIAVEVQGIGWRELEGSWVLIYDNKFTGFMSVVNTGGTARFDIPATGQPGLHIVEIQHSDFGYPYRIFPHFFFHDTPTTEIYTLSLHDAADALHRRRAQVV